MLNQKAKELLQAMADGKTIEWQNSEGTWNHLGESDVLLELGQKRYGVDRFRVAQHAVAEVNAGPHKHADSMALYAEDAKATTHPWRGWQNREVRAAEDIPWSDCGGHPEWNPALEYRRRPKTIRIGTHDVPEPLRVAPERFSKYWVAHPLAEKLMASFEWNGAGCEVRWLDSGIMHSTKEAAVAHAKALLSLTEVAS